MRKYRVGIIGFAHMHVNYLAAEFAAHPQAELICCADTVPQRPELREGPHTRAWNLRHAVEKLGVRNTYDDYRKMLAEQRPDIVISCAENSAHAQVTEACAAAGAHVCFEKPMAGTLQDALRMVRAARAAGTTLVINWPLAWDGACRKAKQLIDAGAIGRILQLKWRAGHTGPLGPGAKHAGVPDTAAPLSTNELAATWWHHDSAGGGAFLDYCCYGCMLARWYLDQPAISAVGMRCNLSSQWSDSDDNGAMIVRFPQAYGIFEASWTQLDPGVPYGPILYGTTGTLVVEAREGRRVVRIERGGGRSEIHEPDPPRPGRDQVAVEMIHHLQTDEPLPPMIEMTFNLDVMAILDAGFRATNSGRMELVDNAAWRMG